MQAFDVTTLIDRPPQSKVQNPIFAHAHDTAYDHDAADADDDDKLLGFVSEAAAYLPMVQHTVMHTIPS